MRDPGLPPGAAFAVLLIADIAGLILGLLVLLAGSGWGQALLTWLASALILAASVLIRPALPPRRRVRRVQCDA